MPTPVFFCYLVDKVLIKGQGFPLKKMWSLSHPANEMLQCRRRVPATRVAQVFCFSQWSQLKNCKTYKSTCMYIYIYIIHIHIYIQIHIHISIYLSIDLSIYLSISLSTYAYMYKYLCRDPRPRLMGLRQGQWPRGNACRGEAVHQAVVQLQAEEPPTSGWFTHWLMGYLSWLIDCEGMVNSAGQ